MSLAKDMTLLREELNNSREKRKLFISELSFGVSQFLKNARDENDQKSKTSKEALATFVSNLSSDVSQFLKNSRDENDRKAKTSKEALAAFVSNLSSDVSEFLKNSHDVNQTTALKTKDELSSFAGNLKQTVGDLLKECVNDLDNARLAFNGVQPPKASQPQPIQQDKTSNLDDLRAISGIGRGLQARLNKLGIHTCEQLAKKTPEELRKSLGKLNIVKFADIESWIREAKKLM